MPGHLRSTPPSVPYAAAAQGTELRSAVSSQLAHLHLAHQQAAVAALGQEAIIGVELATLLEHASLFVAQTLSVELCGIYRVEPEHEAVRLVAGFGWSSNLIGTAVIPSGSGSFAHHVLASAEPVIVTDLRVAQWFSIPDLLREARAVSGISVVIAGPTGPWGILEAYSTGQRAFNEDHFHFLQSVANIISTAHAREHALTENTKLAAFAQHNPNPVLEFAPDARLTYFNNSTSQMAESLRQQDLRNLLPQNLSRIIQDCLATGATLLDVHTEVSGRMLAWSFYPIPAIDRVHAYAVDVTERLNLEAQLRQSQKMEAIGQLAAGVAHDFNNVLTIMQGLVRRLDRGGDASQADTLQQLFDTTERAAALTRQLLTFSRRQVLQSRVMDLREVVSGISRMLQRLIGEDIVLSVQNPEALPAIEADPSMMEQVILNLAVNARDAMPRGGRLVIETSVAEVRDEPHAPRKFVQLRVEDTGCGMTEEVKSRIFEPFFTTKDIGKGTGLGLATVFGIVKQHGGCIHVDSAVNGGTTFLISLPASDKSIEPPALPQNDAASNRTRGDETILFVEDEPLLRELGQAVLAGAGYRVLQAGDVEEALGLWREHGPAIDLLLTDMVLPGGLNGRDLAARLQQDKSYLKVIYTTGYSPDLLDDVDALNFLQKPYPPEVLTRTVRACLDVR